MSIYKSMERNQDYRKVCIHVENRHRFNQSIIYSQLLIDMTIFRKNRSRKLLLLMCVCVCAYKREHKEFWMKMNIL